MRFKPKEVHVLLPQVMMFESEDEAAQLAANFNTFIHGKVHLKYEVLGKLQGKKAVLFYMQRSNESQQLRDEFMELIDREELSAPFDPDEKQAEQESQWRREGHGTEWDRDSW